MNDIIEETFPLSHETAEQFRREGYAVVHDLVADEELGPIEALFDEFLAGRVRGMGRDLCDMSGPYDRPFEDFELVNAVLPRVYRPQLQGNVFERRALSIARQLLGDDATLDYDQFLTKKPGKPGAAFAWHQDLGYWPTGTPDTRTVTLSLALDDADEENGCLGVVPGTHRETELRAHRPVQTSDDGLRDGGHTLAIELGPNDRPVFLPVPRGSVTLHDERIVHGSGGNLSRRLRRTCILAFRSRACVEYERRIGFTHSHNDEIAWETHLDALSKD